MTFTLPEPIAAFVEGVNRHDESAFLDAFTPDGFVDGWGRIFTGRDAIKSWSDKEFIGARGTMTVTTETTSAATTEVLADWRSNWANGPSAFAFVTDGDKIASMTIRDGHA